MPEGADGILRVVACDDDASVLAELASLCTDYCRQAGIALDLRTFGDGDALVEGYDGADVLLLDVEMPLLDGMEAALQIRRTDKAVRIVFVTSFERYAVSGYRVGAYRYLVKPLDRTEFEEVFGEAAAACLKERQEFVSIAAGSSILRVRPRDIVMAETIGSHRVRVALDSGDSYETSSAIGDLEKVLAPFGFFRTHRCYLVNFGHVARLTADEFVMDDGTRALVSKRRHTEALAAFSDYLARTTIGARCARLPLRR